MTKNQLGKEMQTELLLAQEKFSNNPVMLAAIESVLEKIIHPLINENNARTI